MGNTCRPILCLLLLAFLLPLHADTGQTVSTQVSMTNITWFTGSVYRVPRRGKDFREVREFYAPEVFKDLRSDTREIPLRRFEIIFAISYPPVLIWNLFLVNMVQGIEKDGQMWLPLENHYLWYAYGGSAVFAGLIAYKDYRHVRKVKKSQGTDWPFLRRRF